jgi:predicted transcriptional regulator
MDDFLKEALELARAQAGVRVMSEDEISAFVAKVAASLRNIAAGGDCCADEAAPSAVDAKKSIKEKSVTCLECGKSFKILTKRHLSQHGLSTEEYLEKYGLKKGTALVCKALQRERRKKMQEMQLWEKRRNIAKMQAK